MKIGLLTSSRADFGIYYPLAENIQIDEDLDLEIIAFGTHLSKNYGYTVNEIKEMNFDVKHEFDTLPKNDTPFAITLSMSKTMNLFSRFWNSKSDYYDLVLCLGDRYEMFSAVQSGVPFNIKFAHIHAGETTLGAIDDIFRHSISLMSKYLFVTNKIYEKRAREICKEAQIFNVGALSIDNLANQEFLTIEDIKLSHKIDLNNNTILMTFHPETVNFHKNKIFIKEILDSIKILSKKYQIVITMPNADTMGLLIRNEIETFVKNCNNIYVYESLGMKAYLSFMKYCKIILGNSSSSFVEASFFPKSVINLGNRQEGRILTPNIKSIKIDCQKILNTVKFIEKQNFNEKRSNYYGRGNSAEKIINILKEIN